MQKFSAKQVVKKKENISEGGRATRSSPWIHHWFFFILQTLSNKQQLLLFFSSSQAFTNGKKTQLTLNPSFLAAPRLCALRSVIVDMLSKGFLTTCMNFIGTWTISLIASSLLILFGSISVFDVLPPFLSPITLREQQSLQHNRQKTMERVWWHISKTTWPGVLF